MAICTPVYPKEPPFSNLVRVDVAQFTIHQMFDVFSGDRREPIQAIDKEKRKIVESQITQNRRNVPREKLPRLHGQHRDCGSVLAALPPYLPRWNSLDRRSAVPLR
jgi:hypothetical protein